ncbi:DUF4189 domain-containing protein [Stenotrophomonas sp. NPDC077659]|uniref:DUF4189 domain-containing protein n=1 Tax=Stenotrophomonas sp. NPDC077659 TaxID=3390694 RepID=UPI003CFCC4D1
MVLLSPLTAVAQQAGTPEYNSVYLPAHGVGDTAAPRPVKWGAWAKGADRNLGWTFSANSEEEARALAIEDCEARGSYDCKVSQTFFNACAAIAAGPTARRYQISTKGERFTRREVLKDCGADCKIVFAGCAYP